VQQAEAAKRGRVASRSVGKARKPTWTGGRTLCSLDSPLAFPRRGVCVVGSYVARARAHTPALVINELGLQFARTREGGPSLPDRRGGAASRLQSVARPFGRRCRGVRLVSRVHEAAQPDARTLLAG
jgi:hypothetical protein